MKILSHEISEKTAERVKAIEGSVRFPIHYEPMGNRPGNTDDSAGSVDAYGTNGTYTVWLNENLPIDAYEADILHELYHIVQIESGFSGVFNKRLNAYSPEDQKFIQEVGTHLSSVVLDVDVNRRLGENGYEYNFFTDQNYKSILAQGKLEWNLIGDPLNYANLALAVLHASLYVNNELSQDLFDAYATHSDISKKAAKMREYIKSTPPTTPMNALLNHCFIVDTLNLWKYYCVIVGNLKVRTHGEYLKLLEQNQLA